MSFPAVSPLSHDHDERAPQSDVHDVLDPKGRLELSPPTRAARAVVEALVRAGVDTFFGIPGGPAAPIFQALDEVPGARLVESRQESAAAFAAAGFFRATGRVPAVVVTAGPGVTQAVTGIVSASLERVPMVLIAGDVAWSATGGRLAQDSGPEGIAIEEMLAKATRAQVRVARPESAASQALHALDAALDPTRPGPALLVLPMQHGGATTVATRTIRRQRERSLEVDGEAVRDACNVLVQAQRPLLVIGGGCRRYAESMRRLVDALDVPFVTTPAGKGIVSEEHPRSLGHGGLAASLWARAYTGRGVDGCVVLGTDLDDASIGPTRYVADGGSLVHVDVDARVFSRNLTTTLGVVADVEAFADAMRLWWTTFGLRHGAIGPELRQLKSATPRHAVRASEHPLPPDGAIHALTTALPDAIVASDIGEHMLFALHYVTAKGPDRFHIQLSLGSMGSGIATAIGLALGSPGKTVLAIVGDGGMQMMGSEILVAVRERLPIVFAVFNDGRYNMVHHGMKQLYGRAREWDAGVVVDFVKWAEAHGARGLRIDRTSEIDRQDLEAALTRGPLVLDLRIDASARLAGAGRVESLQRMSSHSITGGVS